MCLLLILLCILTWRSQTSLAPRFWFGDGEDGEVVAYVDGAQASVPRVDRGALMEVMSAVGGGRTNASISAVPWRVKLMQIEEEIFII